MLISSLHGYHFNQNFIIFLIEASFVWKGKQRNELNWKSLKWSKMEPFLWKLFTIISAIAGILLKSQDVYFF